MTFELLFIQGSTSNQIPGDQIDNDQDGLLDEEYCGLLWGGKITYHILQYIYCLVCMIIQFTRNIFVLLFFD